MLLLVMRLQHWRQRLDLWIDLDFSGWIIHTFQAATAFFQLEQDFLEIAPFIARSSQVAALMDVVVTQMRGIHKSIIEEVGHEVFESLASKTRLVTGAEAFHIGV